MKEILLEFGGGTSDSLETVHMNPLPGDKELSDLLDFSAVRKIKIFEATSRFCGTDDIDEHVADV